MTECCYTVVYEEDEDHGTVAAFVPALPGCHTEGDNYEDARRNIHEAITCYLQSLMADGEPIPHDIAEQKTERLSDFFHLNRSVKSRYVCSISGK